ncbi:MAG: organic solvent resistance ABC transporter ATP-binding protein [Acidobacteria bacterium]|nr:MAG: organic solvent resistance ABC transporter ATP-binding protein [Acidobacteriota bacterium]
MNAASSEPVISFEDVHLGFGEGDILRGLSFHLLPRETKVLVGETGSGKTLVLKLAAGLLKPIAGHVRVLGHDLGAMTEAQLLPFRREIGFVFQEGALFDSMTVADNVAYRLNEDGLESGETDARVREALTFVEMEDAIDKLPGELSGGMRRRVSIARALVSRPPIVLYDSPTAGLDPITSQTIITLILRLRDTQGVTSILATHRLQDAFALANYRFDPTQNRVMKAALPALASRNGQPSTNFLFLHEGKVYFEGGSQAVLESPDAYLKKFLV